MNNFITTLFLCVLCFQSDIVFSQNMHETNGTNVKQEEKKWYDKMRLSGYAQFRYNRFFETNPNLKCEQCDKSIGKNGGFFIRRTRIILFGQVSKQVYFYIQPALSTQVQDFHSMKQQTIGIL